LTSPQKKGLHAAPVEDALELLGNSNAFLTRAWDVFVQRAHGV